VELIAEARRRSALAGHGCQAELVHEAREGRAELDLSAACPDGRGREPGKREPRIRAVRKTHRRRRVHVESEPTVDALELVWVWTFVGPAVGESVWGIGDRVGRVAGRDSLSPIPQHEAEGASRSGLIGLDRERFLGELRRLRASLADGDRKSLPTALPILSPGSGRGVPNSPAQDLPEAMRTVVSCRDPVRVT